MHWDTGCDWVTKHSKNSKLCDVSIIRQMLLALWWSYALINLEVENILSKNCIKCPNKPIIKWKNSKSSHWKSICSLTYMGLHPNKPHCKVEKLLSQAIISQGPSTVSCSSKLNEFPFHLYLTPQPTFPSHHIPWKWDRKWPIGESHQNALGAGEDLTVRLKGFNGNVAKLLLIRKFITSFKSEDTHLTKFITYSSRILVKCTA